VAVTGVLRYLSAPMSDLIRTAEDYRHYAQKKSNAHYRMSEDARASGRRMGIPVTVATTLVGTSIFATLSSPDQNYALRIGTGLLSLAAAVLSALHTLFNFAETVTQHRAAAADYEVVRHDLDAFILALASRLTEEGAEQAGVDIKALREISTRLDDVAKRAPTVPDRIYDTVQTRVATRPILSERVIGSSKTGPQPPS
jgi:hypothetical protein